MGYFKSDGKFIYLDTQYAEIYIPKHYYENKFAEDIGDITQTFGLLNICLWPSKEMRVLNLPTKIELFVNDFEDRVVTFKNKANPVPCKVIKYNKGNKIMPSSVVEDSVNAEDFVNMINKGKLPDLIPYSKSIDVWKKNLDLNSVYLGVPYVIYELILSAAYRYKKDPTQKFGKAAATENISDYDYITMRIREICQYTSTFTAVTYEDMDAMITTSLNRTKNKTTEAYSPVEDLLKL